MGSQPGDGVPVHETPAHEVDVPGIAWPVPGDQSAVRGIYQARVATGGTDKSSWMSREPPVNQGDHPVVGIAGTMPRRTAWLWGDGRRYRLPTEAEWVRPRHSRLALSLGDEWEDGRCHHSAKGTVPVSAYPEAPAYGCCQILGNVQE
jgi:formylglycine-generating enzyme required for sulfatase activity